MEQRSEKKKRRLEFKMAHLVRTYSIMLLLLFVGIVVYLNVFSLQKIREQEQAKEQEMLDNWVKIWDNMLANNTIFIENFLANNGDMAMFNIADSYEEQLYSLQSMKNTLNEYSLLNYGMNEIFFYSESEEEDIYITSYRSTTMISSMTMKERVNEFITVYENEEMVGKWLVEEVDGQNYLIYMNKKNGNYVGCWCAVDYLIDVVTEGSQFYRRFFITDAEGISRTNKYLNGQQIDLASGLFYSDEARQEFRQISKKSGRLDLYFVEHIEKSVEEESILQIRNMMIFICVLLGGMILLFSFYLEYFMYRPIRELVANMNLIAEGNFESKITAVTHLQEIRVLNGTFNSMVDEIKDLKIAIYEDKIREQKVRLQYYQLQIRPHFLVNALNSVYAMIDMKNPQSASLMCRYLAKYFRFLYNKNTDLVLITEELEHVDTYMQIQKMRRPDGIRFEYHLDEACRLCLVPPLLLQTFVENSMKYGIDMDSQINRIYIEVTKTTQAVRLMIRDWGPGFSEIVLENINRKQTIYQEERECVGINNVLARLRLFYGDDVKMTVFNHCGAVVEIEIPM